MDRETDLERLGARFIEMERRRLWRGRSWDFKLSLCDSKPCSIHPIPSVLSSSMGAHALDATATFPPQSAVRCFQNNGQRASLSLVHGHWALGILLFLWETSWQ